jgi:hypothetical protein
MIRSTSTALLIASLAAVAPLSGQENRDPQAPPAPPPPPPAAPTAPTPPPPPPETRREPRERREIREERTPRSPNESRDRAPGRPGEAGRPDRELRLEDANRRRDTPPGGDGGRDGDRDRGRRGPDGPRRTGPLNDGDRERRNDDRPADRARETPRKPTPYLGVVTASAPAALAAQLNLPEGFGLLVEDVLPDSPAKAAGVQRYDVLKQLNDQQLAEPSQLAALVRGLGKDAEATLTLIRKGQEQKVTVRIGETMRPESAPRDNRPQMFESFRGFDPLRRFPEGHGAGTPWGSGDRMRLRDWLRDYQGRVREYEEQLREWQKKPEGEAPKLPPLPEPPGGDFGAGRGALDHSAGPAPEEEKRPADYLRELRPGPRQNRVPQEHLGGGGSHLDAHGARMVMRDRDGELQITLKDGRRILTAKGPGGEEVFNGPVDTAEQRQAVPEQIRRKMEALEIRARAPGERRPESDRRRDEPSERIQSRSEEDRPAVQ